jgi:hypothetical protein
MIRLGLRLTVSGGREAVLRLVILAAAVGLGTGLLLATVAGINAVNAQNDRYAWLATAPPAQDVGRALAGTDALWWQLRADRFDGRAIARVDVAATGPDSPVPPGIPHLPGHGEYYASPALAALLRETPAGQLADRYPGRPAGTIGDAALPAPDSLVIVIGHTVAQMARMPGAQQEASIATTPPSACNGSTCQAGVGIDANGIDLVLSVVALAMLVPVLIFIGTATRLTAARREQRFAAMRLAGATPQQVSLIAAVESTVAAVLGVVLGFGLFILLRGPLAAIPFTGAPFFPGDLSLSLPDVLIAAIGVPAVAAVAAWLALRRVRISPLGAARRVTPAAPKAWRIVPLLAGLAELGLFAALARPGTTPGQIGAFLPGFLLIMAGLVAAGPWLTMAAARIMARQTDRPGTLIAARRLAENPKGSFRAVSGLVLALFVTTVAVTLMTTQHASRVKWWDGPAAANVLAEQFYDSHDLTAPTVPQATLTRQLRHVTGVQGVAELHPAPGQTVPDALLGFPPGPGIHAGLVSCAQLATIPAFGRCPAGAAAVAFPVDALSSVPLDAITWPATKVASQRLETAQVLGVYVATNGSVRAIEQARTLLEAAYPTIDLPATLGENLAETQRLDHQYQQLADVVILVSLTIAGCTLAASVAAGLADRKRPFSLLRLAGARLGMLRRVVALESAVPLLAGALVAIGLGFAVSAMYATAVIQQPLAAPGAAYYLITVAGIVVSLGIIAATMPLLRRITGPEAARSE